MALTAAPSRLTAAALLPADCGWYNLCMLATLFLADLLDVRQVQMGPVNGLFARWQQCLHKGGKRRCKFLGPPTACCTCRRMTEGTEGARGTQGRTCAAVTMVPAIPILGA